MEWAAPGHQAGQLILGEPHLEALPKPIKARLAGIIVRLEEWPHVSGAKPLRGNLAGWYRVRTGDYRVRFRVEGEAVIIDHVGHRSTFYEG